MVLRDKARQETTGWRDLGTTGYKSPEKMGQGRHDVQLKSTVQRKGKITKALGRPQDAFFSNKGTQTSQESVPMFLAPFKPSRKSRLGQSGTHPKSCGAHPP